MSKTEIKPGDKLKVTGNMFDGETYHCIPLGTEVEVIKKAKIGKNWEVTDGDTEQILSEKHLEKP